MNYGNGFFYLAEIGYFRLPQNGCFRPALTMAEAMRERCINEHKSFTFETVLSTDRNLELLKKARPNSFSGKMSFWRVVTPSQLLF